jgi:hypothetical protein
LKVDATIGQREERVILADADIAAGVPLGPALTHENIAGGAVLTAENLDAEALTGRIATIAR